MSRYSDALDAVSEAADDGTLHANVRRLVAIDPGKKGAIIAERGSLRRVWRADLKPHWQPGANADPDPLKFGTQWDHVIDWLGGAPDLVGLEAPSWHAPGGRKMNAGVAGRLGMEHMAWRMLFMARRVPFEVVRPKRWQKAIGVVHRKGLDVKAEVQRIVGARLPDVDQTPGRITKPHDGIADAAGILLYVRSVV
jgi:hypothetical protein